jgi:fluoride exporter
VTGESLSRLFLVCLGGAAGSGLRYATALWAANAFGPAFPYGTLIVNIAGSFAVGFLMHLAGFTGLLSPELRLMLTSGLFGGFTTYSTFNYETTAYLRQGAWGMGLLNVVVTLVGCLVAGVVGFILARLIFGR